MKVLRAWLLRLARSFRPGPRDGEFAAEIESHLHLHIADNLRAGMSPQEARRVALLKLGGVELTRESWRDRNTIPYLEHLAQDLRFAFRQLRKSPAFAATAILILALGLCASLSIFAFVDAALIKPLPYPDPARLVNVTETVAMFPRANLSYPDYVDWKRLNHVFASFDVYKSSGEMLRSATGVELVRATRVSDGFFRTLGVAPLLGRDFAPGEDRPSAPPTVILTYAAWQKRFGGRNDVLGQTVTLSGTAQTIVGVLPRDFQFALREGAEFWMPLRPTNSCDTNRSCHSMDGIARLKDGVSPAAALAEMKAIAQQLEQQYPGSNRGQGAFVAPLAEVIVGDIRPILLVLLAGAGMLLLIGCANVSSLLLARADSRKREMAVRGALGASTGRLFHQFLIEGIVLMGIGGIVGVAAAHWAMQILSSLISADMMMQMPYLRGLGLNWHVVAAGAIISLAAAILFSVTPVLRLPSTDVRQGLTEGSRGSAGLTWRRFGSHLVVFELAIAMVLLAGAGLLGRSFYRLLHVELGFQPDRLATLGVAAPRASYGKDEQAVALGRQVVARVSQLPGVQSVAIGSLLPVSFNGNTDWIRFVGRPYHGEHNEVNEREVGAAWFTTLGARLLRGRYFTDAEDASKPRVVIVNQALVRKYFPNEDPIGKKIGNTDLSPQSLKEIVGVVDDIKEGPLDSEIWPAVYYPFNQSPDAFFRMMVRTSQPADSLLPTVAAVIRQMDPGIATVDSVTMADRIADSPSAYLHRSSTWLVGGFASLALLLGVVGLYGVVAYSVSQRTREIGVRMALGAQKSTVYRLILQEAARLTAIGIVAGLAASLAAATLMRKLLFGVSSWDVPTLLAVAAILTVAALLAAYLPARRAASVNPVEALRAE